MGGSIGGGSGRSNLKQIITGMGTDAGRLPGWLDEFMGMYGRGAQQNQALSDRLLGGQGYGASNLFRGNGAPPAAGAGAPPPAPGGGTKQAGPPGQLSVKGGPRTAAGGEVAPGGEGDPLDELDPTGGGDPNGGGDPAGGGDPTGFFTASRNPNGYVSNPGFSDAWNDGNDPDGINRQKQFVEDNPQMLADGSQQAPTGGLIGDYENMRDNTWQTGPNGDNETDNLGSYDWMASGERNADEKGVYGDEGKVGEGYGGMAAGPNAAESALYGDTGKYGSTAGEGEQGAMDFYKKEAADPGYDAETKAAMTQEAMTTARSPFERARDRVLRANTARGNPASSMGAEIALARDEGSAIGSAGRKNLIDQAQEKSRAQTEAAQGMQGVQNLANQRSQFGLTSRAGQNAQQASQKLAGLGGQQSVLGQKANMNQQQRDTALKGTQGKQALFDSQWARKNAGIQGLAALQAGAAGQGQTNLAGGSNLGKTPAQSYVEGGNASGSL